MTKAIITEQYLTDIANAIRSKIGTTNAYKPSEMSNAIQSIGASDENFVDVIERTITAVDNNKIVTIGDYALLKCIQLSSVNVPSVKTIKTYAFFNCYSLPMINLPVVESISSYVFAYCSKLTKVILGASKVCTLENTNAFSNTPIASGTGYVYVPDNLVESYKTATNWVTYANQIKGISELGE